MKKLLLAVSVFAVGFVFLDVFAVGYFWGAAVQREEASGEIYFSDNFESAWHSNPNPVWNWRSKWSPTNTSGTFYGEGDTYNRSQTVAHNGSWSLQLDYNGRNDFGNRCHYDGVGAKTHGEAEGTTFVTDDADNLATFLAGSGAEPGSYVWNIDAYMEQWTVDTVTNENATNDKLTFVGGASSGAGMDNNGTGVFSTNDVVYVGRVCGVGERRTDFNNMENDLKGFSADDFEAGESIFTRFYIYIPTATTVPDTTQKLFRFTDRDGEYMTGGYDTSRSAIYGCGVYGPDIVRDTWYYYEIEIKSASASGAGDGECRVWFAADGVPDPAPFAEGTNYNFFSIIGPSKLVTFIGNHQLDSDATGYVYFDDVVISSARVGP